MHPVVPELPVLTDLNALYFRHQVALIRANESLPHASKDRFKADADALAGQIARIQHREGAKANVEWSTHAETKAGVAQ